MNIVSSKSEFFAKSQNLVFGNRLRQWSWEQFCEYPDSLPSKISVRNCFAGGDSRVQLYRKSVRQVTRHCTRLISNHIVSPDMLVLDESAPDHRVTLHAEVQMAVPTCDTHWRAIKMGLYVRALEITHDTEHLRGIGMRQAYPFMSHYQGLEAWRLLQRNLDGNSMSCLREILAEYPESNVELSAYDTSVGVLRWNTVFWEVRNY